MKKHIFILALTLSLIIGAFSFNASAAELKSADIRFSYATDEAYIEVSGVTPATYGQHLTVLIYDPATDGSFSLDDVKDSVTGEIADDPASVCPITGLDKVIRIREVVAYSDGSFSAKIPISDSVTDGQYVIIQVSGGGKNSVSSSYIRMYKTAETIENELLSDFQNASESQIGALLKENELLLGVNLDENYEAAKDTIHSLFVSVRDNDIVELDSLNDVLKAWDYAGYLLKLAENPSASDIEAFVEEYEEIIGYDFSENNVDYTKMSAEVHSLAATIFRENNPGSMKEVKDTIAEALALSMVNSKDSDSVTDVIKKYAEVLGIDVDEYETYCRKYSAYEVNKAFVGQDFTSASDVAGSFAERKTILDEKGSSGGGGGAGGGGVGGGGAPSSSHDDSWMTKEEIPAPEEKPQTSEKYSDLPTTHWAYESVNTLSEKGVINGFEDGSFKPENTVTREQFIKMLVSAFELSGEAECDFIDVENGRWSETFVKIAVANGITNGVSADVFAPEATVTRQDAAVMLYRVCNVKNIALSGKTELTDGDTVSDYAKESVSSLAGAGIINGFEDGSFKPFGALTRGQAAKLICALLNR